jgi:hypothetical protein
MDQFTVDRRASTRRIGRDGGRRATDPTVRSTFAPVCPNCRQHATTLAGEAEGGWWFVCESCDHLWNHRLVAHRLFVDLDSASRVATRATVPSGWWLSSAALSWWRFAGRVRRAES